MPEKAESFLAGAARLEITPDYPVHLGGAVGVYRPARYIADPLYAHALILQLGERKLCIVSLDLVIITRDCADRIRLAAVERFGFDYDAVMVHAIQTHTAPGLGRFMVDKDFTGFPEDKHWIQGGEPRYDEMVISRAIEAIAEAARQVQPVTAGVGSGIEGRYAFNRRAINRDGSISMPWKQWAGGPTGPTWIRYIEGPIDPEVGVLFLRGNNLQPVATLLSYTCHPVHVFPKLAVSADWPGAWEEAMCASYGSGIHMVLNGCCGNINPWPPFDPDYVEDHQAMGQALASMSRKIIDTLEDVPPTHLDWKTIHLKIPFRPVPQDSLNDIQAILDAQEGPRWANAEETQVDDDWMTAASIYSAWLQAKREGVFDYEIQVFRIGDVVFVGLPGEPFVEGQLRIKLASPAIQTYVVHMINQYVGYIPIEEAIARGGHEGHVRYWSKLVPEALEMIVDAAIGLVNDLFATVPAGR